MIAGVLTRMLQQAIAELALAAHLPSCTGFREAVEGGALLSFGPDLRAMWRQAARMVAKIIGGTPPSDIPIKQPTEFVIAVNLGAARRLGINLPQALVARADAIVE